MGRPRKIIPIADTATENVPVQEITVAPVPPPPTSPAVLALQSSIVDMIAQRAEYRKIIASAQAELFAAQARVQAANGDLLALESEVNYRMSVIAQMENRAPRSHASTPVDPIFPQQLNSLPMGNFSSEPAMMPRPQANYGEDVVNRAHADRSML